ncbi:MAG: 16S rRNA (uracil(1498)-N(3))-methyltransferase, partial [Armatimonadetes bacterium]|nr:16S rRNA (uracil(1498)-N(3))-methyltransferase [Armatimonadota bacterium]
ITEIGASEVTAQPLSTTYPETESPFPVHLFQALLKGEKLDWVVEKATELGATAITLFPAQRSVKQVREERADRKTQRWNRIAKEAAEQCGRVRVPEVRLAASMTEALAAAAGGKLFIADEEQARPLAHGISPQERKGKVRSSGSEDTGPGGLQGTRDTGNESRPIGILVGPEGGWTDGERAQARQCGAQTISLGPRILRAETAAVVALAKIDLL